MIGLRALVNWINLSTPLGLLLARLGGATVRRHDRRTFLATGYRWRFPVAGAFTVGSVVVSRHPEAWFSRRAGLLAHEDRHVTQYAWCLGPVMVVLYGLAAGLSWLLAADHSSYNPFERLAGLADGDYPPPATRLAKRRARRG